ncbi:histidine kinase N-terminal 7TM domain-containing protein [Chloroflexota bacterium]
MNPWSIIPLVSFFAYIVLAVPVLMQARNRVNKIFAVFLFASASWSFTSFMLTYGFSYSTQYLIFWNGMVITMIPWAIVSYYHFVREYNNRTPGIGVYIGYVVILIILALSLSGHVVENASLVDGYLYHDIGPWTLIITSIALIYTVIAMWMLVHRYRGSTNPIDRNKTMYLMVGWGILAIWGPTNANVPLLALLPTDHLGNMVNALIIAYAISKFQLLDIRIIVRKGLAYFILTIALVSLCIGAILLLQEFLPHQPLFNVLLLSPVRS